MMDLNTEKWIFATTIIVAALLSSTDAQEALIQQPSDSSDFSQLMLQENEARWVLERFGEQTSLFGIRKKFPGALQNANVFERFEQNRQDCLASILMSATCTPATCSAAQREYIKHCFARIPLSDQEFIPFGVRREGIDSPIKIDPTPVRETVAVIRSNDTPVCSGFFTKSNGRTFFISAEHCFGQISGCKQPCLVRGNGKEMDLGEFIDRDIELDISVWLVSDVAGALAHLDAEDTPSRSSTLVGLVVGERSTGQIKEMILASGPQTDCRILRTTPPWRCHQCQTLPKSSGSPLFSYIDRNWVVSGMHVNDGSASAACRAAAGLDQQLPQLAVAGSAIRQFLSDL